MAHKRLLLITAFILSFPVLAQAQAPNFRYTSYYPAPYAQFNRLRLFPQDPAVDSRYGDIGTSCTLPGTLYFNTTTNLIHLCGYNSAGTLEWAPLPGVWTQEGTNVFLTDPTSPELKRVSITPMLDLNNDFIDNFKLSLSYNAGIIAKGTFNDGVTLEDLALGTRLIWYPKKAAFRAGGMIGSIENNAILLNVSGQSNRWNDDRIGNASVAFGANTQAQGDYSGILSGFSNTINNLSDHSVIIGGFFNTITDSPYAVSAGPFNGTIQAADYSISFGSSTISSGQSNTIVIGGSIQNGSYNFIGSNARGSAQIIGSPDADYVTILNASGTFGGDPDSNISHSFIGSGTGHTIQDLSHHSTIMGGQNNRILAVRFGTILGGEDNVIQGKKISLDPLLPYEYQAIGAAIGGGKSNRTFADYCTILGGENNRAGGYRDLDAHPGWTHATHATIGGGKDNKAFGLYSFIGGGENNRIGSSVQDAALGPIADPNKNDGQYSVIGGGRNNTILADYAFIGTGDNVTIDVGGNYSVVETGKNIYIGQGSQASPKGTHSWAMGRNIHIEADRVWAWGYKRDEDAFTDDADPDNDHPILITQPDSFIIFNVPYDDLSDPTNTETNIKPIRVGIQTTEPNYTLDVNGDIQAANVIISDISGPASDPKNNGCISGSNGEIGRCDLAEVFETNENVEPGDVLILDPESPASLKLIKSSRPYDKKVVGVVSTRPALVFEGHKMSGHAALENTERKPPVALSGQVPCKVSLENGPIKQGDLLTTSSTPGHAMRVDDPKKAFGTIIGKALEPFNTEKSDGAKTGVITVFVALQ